MVQRRRAATYLKDILTRLQAVTNEAPGATPTIANVHRVNFP